MEDIWNCLRSVFSSGSKLHKQIVDAYLTFLAYLCFTTWMYPYHTPLVIRSVCSFLLVDFCDGFFYTLFLLYIIEKLLLAYVYNKRDCLFDGNLIYHTYGNYVQYEEMKLHTMDSPFPAPYLPDDK